METKTLEVWFKDGRYKKFNNYTVDTRAVVRHKATGDILRPYENKEMYNVITVRDELKKQYKIRLARAVTSTFYGKPETLDLTADHIDRNRTNDVLDNLRWACGTTQGNNRNMPDTLKSSFIVVKDGIEKTVQGWVDELKDTSNSFGREYTSGVISTYARRKRYGFSYKEYPDLLGEVWKEIKDSKTKLGRWEISNMSRVKFITKHTTNVLSGERLGLAADGYPNNIMGECHIIAYKTFFPYEWSMKRPEEMILHKNDDKLDFRPQNLYLGTRSQNGMDAHENGCHDGTKRSRQKCASYIKGVFEKEHDSQHEAVRYLKSIGFSKAQHSKISMMLSGDRKTAYKRTWKLIP
jgi:hypothetical protein